MKFWLNKETDSIYLDQLIKATGIITDYKEIIRLIQGGKVKVNDETVLERRILIYEGDRIRFGDNYINVAGEKEAVRLAELKEEPEGRIVHGKKVNKWKNTTIVKKKK